MMSIVKTASEIEALALARLDRGPASLNTIVGHVRAARAEVLAVIHRLRDEGVIVRSEGRFGTWSLAGVGSETPEATENTLRPARTPGAVSPDSRLLAAGHAAGAACAA